MFNAITTELEKANISFDIIKFDFLDFPTLRTKTMEVNVLFNNSKPWFFADSIDGKMSIRQTDNAQKIVQALIAN